METADMTQYVVETAQINFSHERIQALVQQLFQQDETDIEKIERAFHFVRDDIAHSWDIQSNVVTCDASEVLQTGHGICYAKSHLLAALLRSQRIPTGFCYQRLRLFNEDDSPYCIHALNAVYIASINRWIRLDARGNKQGVNAQFSLHNEQLAFTVDEAIGEMDYATIYAAPHEATLQALQHHVDSIEMYKHHLPQQLA